MLEIAGATAIAQPSLQHAEAVQLHYVFSLERCKASLCQTEAERQGRINLVLESKDNAYSFESAEGRSFASASSILCCCSSHIVKGRREEFFGHLRWDSMAGTLRGRWIRGAMSREHSRMAIRESKNLDAGGLLEESQYRETRTRTENCR